MNEYKYLVNIYVLLKIYFKFKDKSIVWKGDI